MGLLHWSWPLGQSGSSVPGAQGLLLKRSALLLSALLLLGGCQNLPATVKPNADDKPATAALAEPSSPPTPDDVYQQSQTYYQVLLGQIAQQRGDTEVALSNLLAAAETSNDVSLARQAFALALRQRDIAATLRAAALLSRLEPTNPEARLALALAQLQNNQEPEAVQSLDQALAMVGSNENAQLALLGKFSRAGGPGSLPLLAELATRHPNPEWVLLAAAVQAQHFGDGPYAMAMLDKAMDIAPDYRRALLVKAELLAGRDGEEAIALLREAYQKHPDDRELAIALARTEYSQGQFPEAVESLRRFSTERTAKDPIDKEVNHLFAVSLYMAGDLAAALPRLKQSAEAGEQTGPAGWLCGQAAERLKQVKTAMVCYDAVRMDDGQYSAARRAKAELLTDAEQYDEALAILTEARMNLDGRASADTDTSAKTRQQSTLLASQIRILKRANRLTEAKALFAEEPLAYQAQPEPALLVASLGLTSPQQILAAFRTLRPESTSARQQWALTGAGLFQEQQQIKFAYTLIDDEVAEQPDSVELLYARALLAEPQGLFERCEADLRRVLALDPNHIDALNALGYTLADHRLQLDEARDLIQRAQRARPTSSAVMDSMGWVLFRRGELKAARNWLARAYAMEPEPEVAAHYGEVLWQNGDKKKARQIWREASERAPDNAVLKATLERFK